MRYRLFSLGCLGCLLAAALTAQAADLGVVGPTYPIAEADALEVILSRLKAMERSGELARLQREMKQKALDSLNAPPPVAGLTRTRTPRSWYWDPTTTATRSLTDAQGRTVVAAGTRINPLDYVSLSKHLLFFDARDKAQSALARQLLARYGRERIRLILTGGSPFRLMQARAFGETYLYYDQGGALTRRFGIRHTPALVYQQGKRLRIDEIRP